MGTVNLKTASGGSVILSPANTASDVTITVPASNAAMAINGPAFSAYGAAATVFVSGAATKVTLDTELFDTNNNFASSRFTPTVAGYYQINGVASFTTVGNSSNWVSIYKNGAEYGRWSRQLLAAGLACNPTVSAVVFLNGTTDYVELFVFTNGGNITSDTSYNQMSAAMVRSA